MKVKQIGESVTQTTLTVVLKLAISIMSYELLHLLTVLRRA